MKLFSESQILPGISGSVKAPEKQQRSCVLRASAANIMRKVETQLGLSLVKVCRQVLTLATRFHIWETKTKKRRGTALASLVATV